MDRLRKRADFLRVQESGRRFSTRHFAFLFARRPDGVDTARAGIVASKKVGNAVVRNRIKRVLREAFRRKSKDFPAATDIVVIARAGAHELKLADVLGEVDQALARGRRRSS